MPDPVEDSGFNDFDVFEPDADNDGVDDAVDSDEAGASTIRLLSG